MPINLNASSALGRSAERRGIYSEAETVRALVQHDTLPPIVAQELLSGTHEETTSAKITLLGIRALFVARLH